MTSEAIKIPDLGGEEALEVVEILVAAGDRVQQDDILLVLESDKAAMEIPSPVAGIVSAIDAKVGDRLSTGDIFAHIETSSSEDDASDSGTARATAAAPAPSTAADQGDEDDAQTPEAAAGAEDAGEAEFEVQVPEIGGDSAAEVIEVPVAPGEDVQEGDIVLVLETDKASMEIPAPRSGTVRSVAVQVGDKVSHGDPMLTLSVRGSATASSPARQETATQGAEAARSEQARPDESAARDQLPVTGQGPQEGKSTGAGGGSSRSGAAHAGPAVRKMARELGVDLSVVTGTGPSGRILKEDLQNYVKEGMAKVATGSALPVAPPAAIDFSQFGPIRVEPMSSVQKLTASNMHSSWLSIPRVSQFDEVDVTALEKFRSKMKREMEEQGVRLTPLPFLLKACAAALQKNPMFNASLHPDGGHLVFKEYVHIGMAVDTPSGLLVPVLRDVDKKSLSELAKESSELAIRAKARKLKREEMQGGCFTISSLGNIGGTGFTPIINAPELAILGVSRLTVKPVWSGKKFKPRKMLPLTLAYDHRAINGAVAGRFMHDLGLILADVRRLLI